MNLITFVGFASSGKDKAAEHLINNFGYKGYSFAESLKDACASIFVWDRALLEGKTPESRKWREEVDPWWAKTLGIPNFTPRFALQYIGTDVLRVHFNDALWIHNVARKLALSHDEKVVLTDGRFPNEFGLAQRFGGKVVRIRRGPEPAWFDIAERANFGDADALEEMRQTGVHVSEWAWIGQPFFLEIINDGSLENLFTLVEMIA